jgi:hypothetical protein
VDTQDASPDSMPLKEQFKHMTDLHQFYFEHIIKAAGVSFGILGAVLVYVINSGIRVHVWVALGIPILLSAGTCIVMLLGMVKTCDFAKQVKGVQAHLGLSWRPHAEVLPWIAGLMAILFLTATIGLIVVSVWPELLPPPPP